MKHLHIFLSALTLFTIVGCTEPTIDTSTDETTRTSIKKVADSLPESARQEFQGAVEFLLFSQLETRDILAAGVTGTSLLQSKMLIAIDGKTAKQVLAEVRSIKSEKAAETAAQHARERDEALAEIEKLERKKAQAKLSTEQLKKFTVTNSQFLKKKGQFGQDQAYIQLSVSNGTDAAVSKAHFVGTLSSPGRSTPWFSDSFFYSIPGGLEKFEIATWTLKPSTMSDWSSAPAPADAEFTVIATQLDGPNGETLYSNDDFSERDAERLERLKLKYRRP
ncbi:hypothetical protein HCU74_08285 [Spongiibacter sp. KMU-166]|uniref:Lipoprotein n=1 Tax=Spongiibacter thalassae TaxID=2721624 RepID=A0ABX1GE29_9GAMM|nr:DUF6694 family lipoprotein [Spongiibacter thalassae]NKI17413.1 hypothetical protein [Spongiibacter thalassae]